MKKNKYSSPSAEISGTWKRDILTASTLVIDDKLGGISECDLPIIWQK